ncbi:MAG: hypothetical protein JO127_04520 [Caulobacteraceae bacterium]|nr:hypothetical protein [Caulobacteraceae bacterium]
MAAVSPVSNASTQPERAADFIDSIGVNIHLGKPSYGQSVIMADMAYLGLNNLRNHAIGPKTPPSQVRVFEGLATAGMKFDWLTGGPLSATLSRLDTFLAANPRSIAAIEGPNEVNNFPVTHDGLIGAGAAVAYQADLSAGVRADPLTASIPVLNFTDWPSVAGAADAANGHVYPKAGSQPFSTLAAAVDSLGRLMPGKPVYLTEAGYFTLPGRHGWEGVDDLTQAKLTLNLAMDAARLKVIRLYLYDLIDDDVDPSRSIAGDHFGLFTLGGQAKPSAIALHNLTTILGDSSSSAGSFSPAAMNYTVTGLPASGNGLVIEKASGIYDLVVWSEPNIWSARTNTPVKAPTKAIVVRFGTLFAQASVFDPLSSPTPIQTIKNADAVTIAVTDHPLIIQVSNFAQARVSFGAPLSARPRDPTAAAATAHPATRLSAGGTGSD